MLRIVRWLLVLALCLSLAPVMAQDDDDGGNLDPGMQWRFAETFWNNRNYEDFAAFATQYATANPDHDNVLEAWWRVYEVYRAYRPNPDRKKETYGKAVAACERWEKKYATSNKKRAAQGLWYHALLVDREGGRPQGISLLTDLVKKYPENAWDSVYWHLGEWLREARRFAEAQEALTTLTEKFGPNDLTAHGVHRLGLCHLELGNQAAAIETWQTFLTDKRYNWHWGGVHWHAIDIAERLKRMGEELLARKFAVKLMDSFPGRTDDLIARAQTVLNEKPSRRIFVYPHFNYYYSTDRIDLTAGMNMDCTEQYNLLVRASYVTKENPFIATLTVKPKVEMQTVPGNVKKGDDGGKAAYTADITVPDENGRIQSDWWYKFEHKEKAKAPGNITVTRKWEKAGNTWGQCTIRIQASPNDRWNVYIYLPNDKTNVNNLSFQPNEVRDNGKTFRWYGWYDMSKGWEIKFPIEVGANVAEYYPRIFLDRGIGIPYRGEGGNATKVEYDMKEYAIKLVSEKEYPYSISFPGYEGITLQEIKR